MDDKKLRAFLTVIRTGSLNKAAEEIGYTQPGHALRVCSHVVCLLFVFFTGRLVVPRVRHGYEARHVFFCPRCGEL